MEWFIPKILQLKFHNFFISPSISKQNEKLSESRKKSDMRLGTATLKKYFPTNFG